MPRLPTLITGMLITVTSIAGCNRTPADNSATNSATNPTAIEPVVWLEAGVNVEGLTISLGYRTQKLQPGAWLEPTVAITRTGDAMADAMVFSRLVSRDGLTTLSDEVATVYEPASDGQPACYAQGKLQLPEEDAAVAVRFRIILPETDKEWTRDVSLPFVSSVY